MDRDPTATSLLGGDRRELDGGSDAAMGIGHHVPGQGGDFAGPQPGLDTQQDHHLVAQPMAAVTSGHHCPLDVGGGEQLGRFSFHLIVPFLASFTI